MVPGDGARLTGAARAQHREAAGPPRPVRAGEGGGAAAFPFAPAQQHPPLGQRGQRAYAPYLMLGNTRRR